MLQRYEELKFKRTGGRGRRITLSGGKVTVANASKSKAGETLQIEGEATGLGTLRRLSQAFGSPQWNSFAELVEQLRLFEIDVEKARRPSPPALSDRLAPDGSNLGWFLLWLKEAEPAAFALVCEDVRFVLPGFEGFDFVTVGGADEAVRVDIKESHLSGATPLAQASFGTIRAIALFAMLHDPNPPRLTCLEEVDHGLHPHALDRLVDRMREASERTQIILATHSPALVNRLDPSELVIVEREEHTGGTRIFRPDLDTVTTLRQRTGYDLGELWFSGALGGAL
ncbi:AAA family ATPase [Phenylobacterium sp.]|uniref:AAA family ATPase n=1 Tax=Phenylobacterium sp. TaxID=1871053 RepID=UPI003001C141